MDFLELNTKVREETGKEKAKKIRAKGEIPAIIYGSKEETKLLMVDKDDFNRLIKRGGMNSILKLKTEGDKQTQSAIIKEMQKNPVTDEILHIDFARVAKGEVITTVVPVTITGESPGVKAGGVLQHGVWELEIKALPKNLPTHIEVDIGSLELDGIVRVEDLSLPDGVEVLGPSKEVIVSVVPPTKVEEKVEEVLEEVAEPEVIGKKEEKESEQ